MELALEDTRIGEVSEDNKRMRYSSIYNEIKELESCWVVQGLPNFLEQPAEQVLEM